MPALVKSNVGSLAGTSDDECTRLCPLLSKKRRNFSRISEPVGIVFYCNETHTYRGFTRMSADQKIARIAKIEKQKPLKHEGKEDEEESSWIARLPKVAKSPEFEKTSDA